MSIASAAATTPAAGSVLDRRAGHIVVVAAIVEMPDTGYDSRIGPSIARRRKRVDIGVRSRFPLVSISALSARERAYLDLSATCLPDA